MKAFLLAVLMTVGSQVANAQEAVPPTVGVQDQLIMLLLIFLIFYFLIIRPQSKKYKQHAEMVKALERGDRVVTGGGVEGKVVRVLEDDRIVVEIAQDVEVTIVKGTITERLAKTEPKAGKLSEKKDGKTAPKTTGKNKKK